MKRLSPLSYLGLHTAIGLSLSIFFMWIFGEITESVITADTLVAFDQWVMHQMLDLRTSYLTSFMEAVTCLGGTPVILPGSLLAVGYLLWRRHLSAAHGLAVAVIGGIILNNFLKILFQRPRPINESTLITVSGWSFPSGHAMSSMIFYGMMSYLILSNVRSWNLKIVAISVGLSTVLLIGFSRIYLQVHYVSDVVAGFAGGLFWLCVCITGMEIHKKRSAGAHTRSPVGKSSYKDNPSMDEDRA